LKWSIARTFCSGVSTAGRGFGIGRGVWDDGMDLPFFFTVVGVDLRSSRSPGAASLHAASGGGAGRLA
jgi:hypothetical protein